MTRRSRNYFKMKAYFKENPSPDWEMDFCDDPWNFDEEDEIICYMCQTCGMDSKCDGECPNCGAYDLEPCYF